MLQGSDWCRALPLLTVSPYSQVYSYHHQGIKALQASSTSVCTWQILHSPPHINPTAEKLVYTFHALRVNLTVLKNSWLISYIKGKLKMRGRGTDNN